MFVEPGEEQMGFGLVLLGFLNLFMYLDKTPLSLTKKILSVFPSLLL